MGDFQSCVATKNVKWNEKSSIALGFVSSSPHAWQQCIPGKGQSVAKYNSYQPDMCLAPPMLKEG